MFRIHQTKIIWYQQTWHTIEFSNNKRFRHHEPPSSGWPLRSGATFQSYHLADLCQLGDLISRLNFFGSNRSVRAARVLTLHEISMNAKRSAAVSCTRFSPGFSGNFTPLSPSSLVKSVESVVVNHVSHAGRAQRAGRISPARSLSGSALRWTAPTLGRSEARSTGRHPGVAALLRRVRCPPPSRRSGTPWPKRSESRR